MQQLFFIFIEVILPVFILISIGVILHSKFKIDISTLSKLNIYCIIPGFIFIKLYETKFSFKTFLLVLLFLIAFTIVLLMISYLLGKLMKFSKSKRAAFDNSLVLMNVGNYGVPVNDLVFHNVYAMSVQVMVVTFQNILAYTFGIFRSRSVGIGGRKALLGLFTMPVLYAMIAGILLNITEVKLPNFITVPAHYIANAWVAIALTTLGVQVSRLRRHKITLPVIISTFSRLVVSPIIAFFLLLFFPFDEITERVLLLSAAMPNSVNSAIIAQDSNNEPEFAAQTVLISTIFSMISITFVIFLS